MLNAASMSTVLDVLLPERAELLGLLSSVEPTDWSRSTECPLYSVKGIATHILGDDLSLLSRQRDRAQNGLLQLAEDLPGVDFRTLMDTFNDRWVGAARFLSPELVIELLRVTGDWTATYYSQVDLETQGEPVGFFGARGSSSPCWHAIAREYVERWAHHSQIRRAVGQRALADPRFLAVGIEVIAAASRVEAHVPADPDGDWALGAVALGPAVQAADVLTRAYTAEEVRSIVTGPTDAVALLARLTGRP